LTIVVYGLAVAHTLGAGTDAQTPWLRAFMLATVPVISVLFLVRLTAGWRTRRRRSAARAPARALHGGTLPGEAT
jgi:hypothetical protein